MLNQDGHYILTVDDIYKICRFFNLITTTIRTKEFPQLTFTELRFYDIYTNKCLFSFYDHDGMIRVETNNHDILYEININDVLSKNPTKVPQHITEAIMQNVHNHSVIAAKRTYDKVVNKVTNPRGSRSRNKSNDN